MKRRKPRKEMEGQLTISGGEHVERPRGRNVVIGVKATLLGRSALYDGCPQNVQTCTFDFLVESKGPALPFRTVATRTYEFTPANQFIQQGAHQL